VNGLGSLGITPGLRQFGPGNIHRFMVPPDETASAHATCPLICELVTVVRTALLNPTVINPEAPYSDNGFAKNETAQRGRTTETRAAILRDFIGFTCAATPLGIS